MEQNFAQNSVIAHKTTVAELLDIYARRVSSNKRGGAVECRRIEALKREIFAQVQIGAVTSALLQDWVDSKKLEISSVTGRRLNKA